MSDDPLDFHAAMALLSPRVATKISLSDSGCWHWTAETNAYGYGLAEVGSRAAGTRRRLMAHRVTYEALRGEIPPGMDSDHVCHTEAVMRGECDGGRSCPHRRCCNPWHIEPVTRRENLLRGMTVNASNVAKTHCPQGHPYFGANLNVRPNGNRLCRACVAVKNRKQRERRKALALR